MRLVGRDPLVDLLRGVVANPLQPLTAAYIPLQPLTTPYNPLQAQQTKHPLLRYMGGAGYPIATDKKRGFWKFDWEKWARRWRHARDIKAKALATTSQSEGTAQSASDGRRVKRWSTALHRAT